MDTNSQLKMLLTKIILEFKEAMSQIMTKNPVLGISTVS